MIKKNITQNGSKSLDGVLSIFSPNSVIGKKQEKVEAQASTSPGVILNKDYELPEKMITDRGMAVKTISMSGLERLGEAEKKAQQIDYGSKQKGSFIGIDVDFGVSVEDLVNLTRELLIRGYIDEDDKTLLTMNSLMDPIRRWVNGKEITTQEAEQINTLKVNMIDVLDVAGKRFYGEDKNAYETLLMDNIQKSVKDLKPMAKLYFMDGNEAMDLMHSELRNASASTYNYTKTLSPYDSSRNSQTAKSKLLNNPWYLSHVRAMGMDNPELLDQLEKSASFPYITDLEAKMINEISKHHDQLKTQQDMLKEEFGWEHMNKVFSEIQEGGGTLQELLDMKFYLYDTAIDDEIRNSLSNIEKVSVSFDNWYNSTIDLD
ncbi:MAG: hypothetical protein EOM67_14280, partial [Spirochaetia bacterium]|nr:hypothetical protein [Spirochaetia bacterium]